MTSKGEIETFVELTFFPVIVDDDYLKKIPDEVKIALAKFWGVSCEPHTFDIIMHNHQFCFLGNEGVEEMKNSLRKELIEYYERN